MVTCCDDHEGREECLFLLIQLELVEALTNVLHHQRAFLEARKDAVVLFELGQVGVVVVEVVAVSLQAEQNDRVNGAFHELLLVVRLDLLVHFW